MPALNVTATTDFRAPNDSSVTGLSITAINLGDGSGLTATFGADQFGGLNVSNSLSLNRIPASSGNVTIKVVMATAGSFSTVGWSNSGFNIAAFVEGSSGNDSITGGSAGFLQHGALVGLGDTISGGGVMIDGGGGADTMVGGSRADRFFFFTGDVVAGESIDGGGSLQDRLDVQPGQIVDFTAATILNTEVLLVRTGATANITGAQVAAGGISNLIFLDLLANSTSTINISGVSNYDYGPDLTVGLINVAAAMVNVSGTVGNDTIGSSAALGVYVRGRLEGLAGNDTIFGSAANQTIVGGDGADSLTGSAANDIFEFAPGDADAGEIINGGGGTDRIILTTTGLVNFSSAILTSIEEVSINGGSAQFSSTQVGVGTTGPTSIFGVASISERLDVIGSSVNLSNLTFTNWTGVISLRGGSGADVLRGASVRTVLTGNGGADTMIGGDGNDIFLFSGSEVVAGESIDGGNGVDQLQILSGFENFSSATLTNVEIAFLNGTGVSVQFSGSQIGVGANRITEVLFQSASSQLLTVTGSTVDVSNLTFGNTFGADDTFRIAGTGSADNLIGSSVATQFIGNGGADIMVGGNSNDTFVFNSNDVAAGEIISGGGGTDRLSLNAVAGVSFTGGNLISIEEVFLSPVANATFLGTQIGVGTSLQSVTGSNGVETLDVSGAAVDLSNLLFTNWSATEGKVRLTGTTGADSLIGSSQRDTLTGNDGNDGMDGGAGNDSLDAGFGDDFLTGGSGNDTLIGGSGFDYANYLDAGSGVSVSLALVTAQNTGGSGTDILSGIEGLFGSNFADVLSGDNAAVNAIFAFGGADVINGNGGFDYVEAGDGNDTIDGGAGDDFLLGGNDIDTLTFASAAAAVYVDMSGASSFANGTATGFDVLSSIERVIGSGFSDFLFGSAGADTLSGGVGSDVIFGFGLGDSLDGGADIDYLVGGAGADTITTGAEQDFIYFQGQNEGKDTVTDWRANGFDILCIDEPQFGGGLAAGFYLSEGANIGRFVVGTAATAAIGQFLWNAATSTLSWDADGTGVGAAVQIVTLTGITSLSASDILVL